MLGVSLVPLFAMGLLWVSGAFAPVAPQQVDLAAAEWTTLEAGRDVQLTFEGVGHLTSLDDDHDIDWREGQLKVAVPPAQGIDLKVHTPEALIAVVGTAFEVNRDLTGTTITVAHGRVAVTCAEAEDIVYIESSDDPLRCWATTAAARVNQAEALMAARKDADALAIIDKGLAAAEPHSYEQATLYILEAEVRNRRPDVDAPAMLAAAEAALATGHVYWQKRGHRLAAIAATRDKNCAAARPHLTWMAEQDAASVGELAILADCIADDDPNTAARWLDAAIERADEADLKRKLQRRRALIP